MEFLRTFSYSFQLFSSFTPDEWEAYSSENIAKAERERKASVALRSEINGILMQTYVDLRNIFETVNNEFSKRIEETLTAKRSLEKELARVMILSFIRFFMSKRHNFQGEDNLVKIIAYTATTLSNGPSKN